VESEEWSAEGFGNRQAPDDLTYLKDCAETDEMLCVSIK
jgi:hypothetical protein